MEGVPEAQATEVLTTQIKIELQMPMKNHRITHSFGHEYIHSHKKYS